jgi:hypothetical protein
MKTINFSSIKIGQKFYDEGGRQLTKHSCTFASTLVEWPHFFKGEEGCDRFDIVFVTPKRSSKFYLENPTC